VIVGSIPRQDLQAFPEHIVIRTKVGGIDRQNRPGRHQAPQDQEQFRQFRSGDVFDGVEHQNDVKELTVRLRRFPGTASREDAGIFTMQLCLNAMLSQKSTRNRNGIFREIDPRDSRCPLEVRVFERFASATTKVQYVLVSEIDAAQDILGRAPNGTGAELFNPTRANPGLSTARILFQEIRSVVFLA
jgi:hypothetical protein